MSGTIGRQVTGLALVSIVGVLLISFGIVLSTPPPAPRRMTVLDAATALRGDAPAFRAGAARALRGAPPEGRDSALLARTLARALHVDPARVRAAWIGEGAGPALAGPGQSVVTIAGKDAVVDFVAGGFALRWGDRTTISPATPLPPFAAAVRQADGRWLAVAPREPLLSAWRLQILAAFLLSAALLAPLAWLSARRITRPIRALADAAGRVHLWQAEPAPADGPSEVRAAAAAMNEMQSRLAREAAERTRMLAALAHDLRNPLTGLRLRAEAMDEPARGRMAADIGRMEKMIVQVLDYVRGRETAEGRLPADPASWLRACAEDAAERGEKAALAEPLPTGLRVAVEREGLRRALANLVENAVRYGGGAMVSLAEEDGLAILAVEDEGPGIPEAEMARLVEPFQRLEGSRSPQTGGAGLGLAIADDFARRHGGALRLVNRPGGGLRAEIRLPLASPR
ncbi:MAG TPA: HAMP domain-containing sensor histidine kinase [Allosphingosinicella sp.]|nr:HAMP domain-containing sensor histidine kinase [Allosphingosinicella sp.]